jgi:hypothetical protein
MCQPQRQLHSLLYVMSFLLSTSQLLHCASVLLLQFMVLLLQL